MRLADWLGDERGPGAGALRVARGALVVLALALPVSIAVTEAALLTGLAALGVSRARGRAFTFARSWLEPASLALFGAWFVACCFSPQKADAFWHLRKLYALGLVWLAAETLREPRLRARLVPLLLAGALLTSLVGFLTYAVRVQVQPDYRLQGLFSNQMTSGGVLAAASLWGLGGLTGGAWRRRLAHAAALAPLLTALALTQTRSHWLGFAAGALALLVARAPRLWWTVPAGAVAFKLAAPARLAARVTSMLNPHDPTNQGRLSMWRSGLDIFREHPLTGAGIQDLLSLYRAHEYPDATFESGHFHNNLVQFAVSSGVLGLGAFLYWTVAGFRQLGRAVRAARGGDGPLAASALAVAVAMQVGGMFDFTFGDAEVIYHTYLALGVALAILPARPVAAAAGARSAAPAAPAGA